MTGRTLQENLKALEANSKTLWGEQVFSHGSLRRGDLTTHVPATWKKTKLKFSIYSSSVKKSLIQRSLQVESTMIIFCPKQFWLLFSKKLILHEKQFKDQRFKGLLMHIFLCRCCNDVYITLQEGGVRKNTNMFFTVCQGDKQNKITVQVFFLF